MGFNILFFAHKTATIDEGCTVNRPLSLTTYNIITTLDQPSWYYWLVYGRPSVNQLKKSTLQFCGINQVKVSYFGIIKKSNDRTRQKWISTIEKLGKQNK